MSFSLAESLVKNIQQLLPTLLSRIRTQTVTTAPLGDHPMSLVIAEERPPAALFPVPDDKLNLTPELRDALGPRKVWVTIRAK